MSLGLTSWIGGCTAVIGGMAASDPDVQEAVASLDSETVSDTKKAEHPDWTSGQLNAVESAESYLDGSGLLEGLLHQLKFEEYTKADATFAVNHVKVNWKAEAVESAESYLDGAVVLEAPSCSTKLAARGVHPGSGRVRSGSGLLIRLIDGSDQGSPGRCRQSTDWDQPRAEEDVKKYAVIGVALLGLAAPAAAEASSDGTHQCQSAGHAYYVEAGHATTCPFARNTARAVGGPRGGDVSWSTLEPGATAAGPDAL